MSAFVINPYSFVSEDADAKAYLDAVEAADTQALEAAVRKAVDDFVKGCKADGIWSAIKASCILAGARTLAGALVPLVGSAPTNVGGNFVSGDYDRETGLVGDGSTKYLNSNRANNADPQNNNHNAVYINTVGTTTTLAYMGGSNGGATNASGSNGLFSNASSRSRSSAGDSAGTSLSASSLFGISRDNGTNYIRRLNNSNSTVTRASQTPAAGNVFVFARNSSTASHSDGRLAFYSIGESLALADLDTRVSTLISDIDAAI